jgi:hypothetical protein
VTFEQFAEIVRGWQRRMTPAELHVAIGRCLERGLPVDDLAPGTTVEAVLTRAAAGAEPSHAATKSAPAPVLHGEVIPPVSKRGESKLREQAVQVGKPKGNGSIPAVAEAEASHAASKRARSLLRQELRDGPKRGDEIEARAKALDIPKAALLAATDALGIRTRRGEWRLP